MESLILTAVVVVALTLYTFWAARRGHDFHFLGPFLFGAVLVLMVFALIEVFQFCHVYLAVFISYIFILYKLLISRCSIVFVFLGADSLPTV